MALKWESLEERLGDWSRKIKPFYDNGGFEPIYEYLQKRRNFSEIAPISELTYRAFETTSPSNLTCIIMGLCPYHTKDGNDVQYADGLALSCSNTQKLAPSLEQLYGAWETEYRDGLGLDMFLDPSLEYLAEQGVMLLNAALTTEIGTAKAHQELWKPFTEYLLRDVIAPTGVPIIGLGRVAEGLITTNLPYGYPHFCISHPASASYRMEKWNSGKVFRDVQKLIKDSNNVDIEWFQTLPF